MMVPFHVGSRHALNLHEKNNQQGATHLRFECLSDQSGEMNNNVG